MQTSRVRSIGTGSAVVAGGARAVQSGHVELGLVALIALAVRLVDLDFAPFIDELHHVMAARSLLETGSPNIHEGAPYLRGAVFTYLVAGFFAVFGESLVVGRLPSVLAGALLVSLLFAWLRAEAGRTAAWTGALLLCFAPIALYMSQWVRFYSLHALLFWLAAFGVYHLATRSFHARRWAGIAAASVTALLLAYSLQITTLGGVAGLMLFATLVGAPRIGGILRRHRRGRLIAGTAAVVVAGVLVALWLLGVAAWLRGRMVRLDVWALEQAANTRFYHWLFAESYDVLWTLFPLAVLVALSRRWKLGLLFACVFAVILAVHSISAWKSERFIYFAMPAFFALWGMAVGEVLPRLWAHLLGASRAVLPTASSSLAKAAVAVALALALAFAVASIPAYRYTRQIIVHGDSWARPAGHLGERYRGHPDWAAAAVRLAPLSDSVRVVIGQPDMKLVYYLGDVDYVLYASYLVASMTSDGTLDMRPEFTAWRKVGRPLVSEPESIEAIMRCYATGLIVAEEHVWGWRGGVPRETADFIEKNANSLDLPEELKILAFLWETPEPERSDRCELVEQARRGAPIRPPVGGGP
jgi:4-amino-4-deoxy-L-arabinose transferase-like glycosyltransferase